MTVEFTWEKRIYLFPKNIQMRGWLFWSFCFFGIVLVKKWLVNRNKFQELFSKKYKKVTCTYHELKQKKVTAREWTFKEIFIEIFLTTTQKSLSEFFRRLFQEKLSKRQFRRNFRRIFPGQISTKPWLKSTGCSLAWELLCYGLANVSKSKKN